jgi:hypothetical protein
MRHRHAARQSFCVLSLSDGISARRIPFGVTTTTVLSGAGRVAVGGEDAPAFRAAA